AAPDQNPHHEWARVVVILAESMSAPRVGMVEHRRRARLAVKTLARFFVFNHARAQDLDRHSVADVRSASAVNFAHPSAADAPFQLIAPAEQPSALSPNRRR